MEIELLRDDLEIVQASPWPIVNALVRCRFWRFWHGLGAKDPESIASEHSTERDCE